MPKRIIYILTLTFCLLLIFSSCSAGAKDTTPSVLAKTQAPVDTAAQTDTSVSGNEKDTLDVLYSVSKAFLDAHYHVTVDQAKEYDQLHTEMTNRVSSMSPPPSGVKRGEDLVPDLTERYKALFKQKYQTQPLTDKGYSMIVETGLPIKLWNIVLKTGSDIEVTSINTSLKNTELDDKQNDIKYTINLLINKTSYEVNGVMTLVLVDNKWMADGIYEVEESPALPF